MKERKFFELYMIHVALDSYDIKNGEFEGLRLVNADGVSVCNRYYVTDSEYETMVKTLYITDSTYYDEWGSLVTEAFIYSAVRIPQKYCSDGSIDFDIEFVNNEFNKRKSNMKEKRIANSKTNFVVAHTDTNEIGWSMYEDDEFDFVDSSRSICYDIYEDEIYVVSPTSDTKGMNYRLIIDYIDEVVVPYLVSEIEKDESYTEKLTDVTFLRQSLQEDYDILKKQKQLYRLSIVFACKASKDDHTSKSFKVMGMPSSFQEKYFYISEEELEYKLNNIFGTNETKQFPMYMAFSRENLTTLKEMKLSELEDLLFDKSFNIVDDEIVMGVDFIEYIVDSDTMYKTERPIAKSLINSMYFYGDSIDMYLDKEIPLSEILKFITNLKDKVVLPHYKSIVDDIDQNLATRFLDRLQEVRKP